MYSLITSVVFLNAGLAKRVRARLLMASTSEIYGGRDLFFLWNSTIHSAIA